MNNNKTSKVVYIAIYAGILYVCLHYLHVANSGSNGLFKDIEIALNEALMRPFAIGNAFKNMQSLLKTIGVVSLVYFIACFMMAEENRRNAHYKSDEAKGTAKWNTDFKKFEKKYTLKKKGNDYIQAEPFNGTIK